ncbi:acyl carrier protein [Photobacterium sp. GJ3]|uniref:acyl carrier protein n=1 Tax=Photobacterium sp. GJ3 TaxID=2829502 RepID=UPI001B8B0AE5|nr:acyl carrier protein [Photobacterium sp. GJ3]QUJ66789.1 acyl carrier protein [Photobacterium sp. GJ3]
MKNKIKEILMNEFGLNEESIMKNETLEDMNVDSIIMIEVQLELEREFNISVPDGDISPSFTLTDLVHYVREKDAVNV